MFEAMEGELVSTMDEHGMRRMLIEESRCSLNAVIR